MKCDGRPSRVKWLTTEPLWELSTSPGLPELRADFEPLAGHTLHVSNTRRTPESQRLSEAEFTAGLLAELEQLITLADASTVAMVIMEPVQNHGGMLVPPEGYFKGVRDICDRHGIRRDETPPHDRIAGLGELSAPPACPTAVHHHRAKKASSSVYAVIGRGHRLRSGL